MIGMNALRRSIHIRELRTMRVHRIAASHNQQDVDQWVDATRRAGEQ